MKDNHIIKNKCLVVNHWTMALSIGESYPGDCSLKKTMRTKHSDSLPRLPEPFALEPYHVPRLAF